MVREEVERLTPEVTELQNLIQGRLGIRKDVLEPKPAGSKPVYTNASLEEVLEALRILEETLRNESGARFECIKKKLKNVEDRGCLR